MVKKMEHDLQALMHVFPNGCRSFSGDARHDDNLPVTFFKDSSCLSLVKDSKTFNERGLPNITLRRNHLKLVKNHNKVDESGIPKIVLAPIPYEHREGNGLLHISQGWHEQGHISVSIPSGLVFLPYQVAYTVYLKKGPVVSKDLLGNNSSKRFLAVQVAMSQLAPVADLIKERMMDYVDADLFNVMERSYKAGSVLDDFPAPYMTVALLYKLQVGLHCDKDDFGLSAMVNAGSYSGGNLIVPDLGLKLE